MFDILTVLAEIAGRVLARAGAKAVEWLGRAGLAALNRARRTPTMGSGNPASSASQVPQEIVVTRVRRLGDPLFHYLERAESEAMVHVRNRDPYRGSA